MNKIILSYAHQDSEVADKIVNLLKSIDVEYYRDEKNSKNQDSHFKEIFNFLLDSPAIIFIVSTTSYKSHWIPLEIGMALGSNMKIISFILNENLHLPDIIKKHTHTSSLEEIKKIAQTISGKETAIEFKIFIDAAVPEENDQYFDWEKSINKIIDNQIEVSINLSDKDIPLLKIEEVLNATDGLLDAIGYELEQKEEYILGSFFQNLWYKLKKSSSNIESSEKLKQVKDKINNPKHLFNATSNDDLTEKVIMLIKSLENIDQAVLDLDNLLIVKTIVNNKPTIIAEFINESVISAKSKDQSLYKKPDLVYELLRINKNKSEQSVETHHELNDNDKIQVELRNLLEKNKIQETINVLKKHFKNKELLNRLTTISAQFQYMNENNNTLSEENKNISRCKILESLADMINKVGDSQANSAA